MSKHREIRGLKEILCIEKKDPPPGRRPVGRHWLPAHHCFPAPTFRVLTWGQMHLSLAHEFLKGVSNGKRQEAKYAFPDFISTPFNL